MRRLVPLLVLLACSPPPSAVLTPSQPPPPPEISTIVIPITSSLKPLLPQLEANIPKSMQKLDAYEMDPQNRFGLKYKVTREPVTLNMVGSGLHATTTVHYALEGCARAGSKMWPCVSCGFGEPMRDATIALHSHFTWDQNWRLRSTTTVQPVDFPNKCGVTFFNINISDWKLAPLVNAQLKELAKTIDGNTPKLSSLRPQAQQMWTTLQTPVLLAPRTWLVLEPTDIALGPIRGSGLDVQSTFVLRTRTRVIVGEKPSIAAKPLPPLRTAEENVASGIRVPFDLELTYDEASRLLNEQFAGKKFADLTIESLKLMPSKKKGRISIEATIAMKHYRGPVTLDGVAKLEPETTSLAITDVDYELNPKHKSPFLRLADRVSHDTLRARLRDNARWTVTKELNEARAEIDRGMTRQLAPGATLRGHITSIEPVHVIAGPQGINIRAIAVGTAEVTLADGARASRPATHSTRARRPRRAAETAALHRSHSTPPRRTDPCLTHRFNSNPRFHPFGS